MSGVRHIWRAHDIRGRTPDEVTPGFARHLGIALGAFLSERGGRSVAVGRDARDSGAMLQMALQDGLASAGMDVANVGQVPTPTVYFAADALGFDAGVVVTASHNPPGYNGFKVRLTDRSLISADLERIRALFERQDVAPVSGGSLRELDIRTKYLDFLVSDCRRPSGPLRMVIDAGNGVAGPMAVRLFSRLGVEVVPLFCDPDGQFPNHPADPSVERNLRDLQRAVLSTGADLGIGLDGDGDRLGVVDRTGNLIFGDRLLALFATSILSSGPAAVVADVKCSMALREVVEAAGGRLSMTRTGYPWIQAQMRALSAPLGGEMSGHYCFADRYFGFDDALYAATRALSLVSDLPERIAAVPTYPSIPELRLPMREADKRVVLPLIQARFSEEEDVIAVDGIRFSYGAGWGLIRTSNTEARLSVRAEARTEADLAVILQRLRRILGGLPVEIDLSALELPTC
ncbi:MAG: phosphomannomutase/phosphoglucomutase [Myxococcota bacterium]